jgi:hypothetical protein
LVRAQYARNVVIEHQFLRMICTHTSKTQAQIDECIRNDPAIPLIPPP